MANLFVKLDRVITISVVENNQLLYAKTFPASNVDDVVSSIGDFQCDVLKLYVKPDIREGVEDGVKIDEVECLDGDRKISCYVNMNDISIAKSLCTMLKIRSLEVYNCFSYVPMVLRDGVWVDTYHYPLFSLVVMENGKIKDILTSSHQGLLKTLSTLNLEVVRSPSRYSDFEGDSAYSLVIDNSNYLTVEQKQSLVYLNCLMLSAPCKVVSVLSESVKNISEPRREPTPSHILSEEVELDISSDINELLGSFDISASKKGKEKKKLSFKLDAETVRVRLLYLVAAIMLAFTVFMLIEIPDDIIAFKSKLLKYEAELDGVNEDIDFFGSVVPTKYNYSVDYTNIKANMDKGLLVGVRFIYGSIEIVTLFDSDADYAVYAKKLSELYTVSYDESLDTQSQGSGLVERILVVKPK
jgi:hypothetical protein